MQTINKVPKVMFSKAATLNTGQILFVYRDGKQIRMETEYGRDPYVWRNNNWRRMRRRMAFPRVIAQLQLTPPLQPLPLPTK